MADIWPNKTTTVGLVIDDGRSWPSPRIRHKPSAAMTHKPYTKMASSKKLGIWMDHASANLMEFTRDPIETKVITSAFTLEDKVHTLNRSETMMHHKEQHEEGGYYKRLGETIRDYDDVLLFGPTDAKVELLNQLRTDHRFEKIKIEIRQADKMTDNQQHAFVKDYFSWH